MDRRTASIALALAPLASALPARSQAPRTARVALVLIERENPDSPFLAAFRRGMRDAGWVEGRNLAIDTRWGGGIGDSLDQAIAGAIAGRPDVLVAGSGLVVRPVINAGVTTPVVFVYSGDPVVGGVVESYARPGVNRTGVSLFSLQLVPKRIEYMKELMPGMRRLAIVGWPRHAGEPAELDAAVRAAAGLGLEHVYHPVNDAADVDAAYDRARAFRADAILAFADGITSGLADRFAARSRRDRIPVVSGWAIFAEKGNLMTYGPVLGESHARLAVFVDRILKGAKAADLAVERPTVHELVVNRRVAKELGIAVPPTLLARADRIID
jgi:putative ABC transport system substrate-binding protein